jgi:hypothetical protein
VLSTRSVNRRRPNGGGLASREAVPPGAALQGSEALLISLSELLGAERLGLPAPVVPLLPQLVAVLLDLSERQLEARQLGFSGRQFESGDQGQGPVHRADVREDRKFSVTRAVVRHG